ncbi:MAG: adenine deaminase [Desulfitobacteriaceae bacterium]
MKDWKQHMDEARGLASIDLVLRQAKLVNVLSGEVHLTDIGIHEGIFVGLGDFPKAERIFDLGGKFVVPGLIDGHVHIESSLLCPEEFCSLLLAHGVTTAVVDPHEIANVLGTKGIRYILAAVNNLPFNAFVALPSCVPATDMETSGARLGADALREFIDDPQVLGLGEIMDYRSVLEGKPAMVEKLKLPVKFKDGHAPGMTPQDLNAYFLAGIHTDHECSTVEEARERLRRGFHVMLREGSAAKDLLTLLPVVTSENAGQCLLVTDDRHPGDLLNEGSMDHLVRMAIRAGQPPVRAIQMATLNAARALGLSKLGAVAPGYQADFIVLNHLENFEIEEVYWRGQRQSRKGERPDFKRLSTAGLGESVNLGDWHTAKLHVPGTDLPGTEIGEKRTARVRVIGIKPHSLNTASLVCELPVKNGWVQPDRAQRIAKIAVLERHHGSGRVGVGFVQGLGLERGAIASTVAHDSHNLVVAGMSDSEMDLAVQCIAKMGGGFCLVDGDKILGKLPLPIAGLMSERSPEEVAQYLLELHRKARVLGLSDGVDPFMTLAFLSLPVIPALKITDHGLIDVQTLSIIPVVL